MSYNTLSDLRTDVRSKVNQISGIGNITDTEINRWINLGYHDYAANVQPCKTWLAYTIPVILKATFNLPNNSFGIERINWCEQWPVKHLCEMSFRPRAYSAPGAVGPRPQIYTEAPIGNTTNGAPNTKQFEIWQPPSIASVQVTLANTISPTSTTIQTTTPIPSGGNGWTAGAFNTRGYFYIENEQIRYWGIATVNTESGPQGQFLNCERGTGNTLAVSHTASFYSPNLITYAPMQVLYRFDPPDLASDSDTIQFSAFAWHEALVCFAAAECFTKMREPQMAASMKAEYIRIRTEAQLVRERETLDAPRRLLAQDPADATTFWW